MPPVIKRSLDLDLPPGQELDRMRKLDSLMSGATKELGVKDWGRSVSVDAADGAEYSGEELDTVVDEVHRDARELQIIWLGFRTTFLGDFNATTYATLIRKSVRIQIQSEDEGWVHKTDDLVRRSWEKWDADLEASRTPAAGVTIRAEAYVNPGATAGESDSAESSVSTGTPGIRTTDEEADHRRPRWSSAKKVAVSIVAVVGFLASVATIVSLFTK